MCNSCDAVTINGVYCHELGCPDSWKDYKRDCQYCGGEFLPEFKLQKHCSQSCYNAEVGFPELADFNELLPDGEVDDY